MKKRLIILCFLFALILALGSCAPAPSAKDSADITVAFIPKLTENAFFEAANKGAQAYAQKHGFQVAYLGSPTATVEDQIAIVQAAIERKPDAICISSLDAIRLDDVLRKAGEAGIHVTTWDSDVSGDIRTIMVSQGTPTQLGTMLVEMGAKSVTDQGKNPSADPIRYVWHYSRDSVADQNSWQAAGEAYIRETYPNWVNMAPDNYYSDQNPDKAVAVGKQILSEHPDIDLIICNDSTALPGQAEAAQSLGLSAEDLSITGFASPNAMREYCKAGILTRWGLWDCQIQGALGCYLSYYLACGNPIKVGDRISVPGIGIVEVMPNTVLDAAAYTAESSGVVLLPERTEFTAQNVDDYDF